MALCRNCGQQLDDKAAICIYCGEFQKVTPAADDKGGFGWGLLGWCIPIVGLVLYMSWKYEKPKNAKAAGLGALIAVGCTVFFNILHFVIIFVTMGLSNL